MNLEGISPSKPIQWGAVMPGKCASTAVKMYHNPLVSYLTLFQIKTYFVYIEFLLLMHLQCEYFFMFPLYQNALRREPNYKLLCKVNVDILYCLHFSEQRIGKGNIKLKRKMYCKGKLDSLLYFYYYIYSALLDIIVNYAGSILKQMQHRSNNIMESQGTLQYLLENYCFHLYNFQEKKIL